MRARASGGTREDDDADGVDAAMSARGEPDPHCRQHAAHDESDDARRTG